MEADRLPTRDARTPKPRGGNLANCAAATIMRPYLMVFHGHTAARDHTPRVQPRHTHRRRATPGRHSPATSNTYYLPRYVPRRVLPRARNKPALFLRVIENFRQTRTANLAWYAATVGTSHHRWDCDRPIGANAPLPRTCPPGSIWKFGFR